MLKLEVLTLHIKAGIDISTAHKNTSDDFSYKIAVIQAMFDPLCEMMK